MPNHFVLCREAVGTKCVARVGNGGVRVPDDRERKISSIARKVLEITGAGRTRHALARCDEFTEHPRTVGMSDLEFRLTSPSP